MLPESVALQRVQDEAAPTVVIGRTNVEGYRHERFDVENTHGLGVESGRGSGDLYSVGGSAIIFSAPFGLKAGAFVALGLEAFSLLASGLTTLLGSEGSDTFAKVFVDTGFRHGADGEEVWEERQRRRALGLGRRRR